MSRSQCQVVQPHLGPPDRLHPGQNEFGVTGLAERLLHVTLCCGEGGVPQAEVWLGGHRAAYGAP